MSRTEQTFTEPSDAFVETEIDFEHSFDDDGIGPYEYCGQRGFDKRPVVRSECSGTVTLTWVSDETEVTGFSTSLHDDYEDVDLDVTASVVGELEIETLEEDDLDAVWGAHRITATFSYSGEGSRAGETCDDGSDQAYDEARDREYETRDDDYRCDDCYDRDDY